MAIRLIAYIARSEEGEEELRFRSISVQWKIFYISQHGSTIASSVHYEATPVSLN
jgi:hypothetical protein